jgi:hypothetical protein
MTDREFSQVNWDAHGKAFTSLTRGNQIMVAKLIHNIVNTNQQNSIFYGKSPIWPCCQTANETLPHLLSCQSPGSIEQRDKALITRQKDLRAINTPQEVIDAISHGIIMWIKTQHEEQTSV